MLPLLAGCNTVEFKPVSESPRDFTIAEAREYFEESYTAALTRSGDRRYRSRLSPGEFTPEWSISSYGTSGRRSLYDIPIISDRKLTAVRARYSYGKVETEKVPVRQSLIVSKSRENGRVGGCILTLVPDSGGDAGRKMLETFRYGAVVGDFSGTAIYTRLVTNTLIRFEKYRDGRRVSSVYVPKGDGTERERCKRAARLLNGIRLSSRHSALTKSGEDYWDDWDYCDGDDYDYVGEYEDLGGGIYEGSDGALYYDEDGDGVPDTMFLEPSVCYPDDDWEEEGDDDSDSGDGNQDIYNGDDYWYGSSWGSQSDGDDDKRRADRDRGLVAIQKMSKDLNGSNVRIREIGWDTAGKATLMAAGIGFNANSLILSAAYFLDDVAEDMTVVTKFGQVLGYAGWGIGFCQTIIGFTDGDVSLGDWMNLTSLGLSVACVFIPEAFPVAIGALTIASAVIGLTSNFILYQYNPGWYIIPNPNGGNIYLYVSDVIQA